MIDIAKATETLENYFANVTDKQFAIDLEKFCPELFENDIDIVPAQSAAAISNKFHLRSLADLPGELVRIRSALGMTQQELGEKVGMSELEVQTHEAEGYRSISFAQLTEVAEALGITSSQLVVEIDRLLPTDDRTRTICPNRVDRLHHWWENSRSIVIVATKSVAGNGSHISESESASKVIAENKPVSSNKLSLSVFDKSKENFIENFLRTA
jgi:transcriptional regulator with XRE-family HTH domain